MNIEILYRGFHETPDSKERAYYDGAWHTGEWVEGNLIITRYAIGAPTYEIASQWTGEYYFQVKVAPTTVGRYTGLQDKNGRRIFEWDIIDMTGEWWDAAGPAGHDSPICVIEYDPYTCGFDPFATYDCDCGVYINAEGCEVIGNIHDNPEPIGGVDNGGTA